MRKGLITLFSCLLLTPTVYGAGEVRSKGVDGLKVKSGTARYVVLLDQPTLLQQLREVNPTIRRADLGSDLARDQLQTIDARFEDFEARFEREFGRPLDTVHRYRYALNGFSARLDGEEVRRLAQMDGVRSVQLDKDYKLNSFAGPRWLGADRVWEGEGALPENRGEGIVIGVIDSGINWDHPSFADSGESSSEGHDHENPYGRVLGLCAETGDTRCNDKLVGIYDFVEDNPDTEVIEEFNDGADNGAHGAHTAGTAGGNPVGISLGGQAVQLSGVAPNANVISYRVCYAGDPDDSDDDACQGSAILQAIDQAVADGVDVINYSVGGDAFNPWVSADATAYLEAVAAGVFVATSAGNAGPGPGTIGRPANAPWITAVGSATHGRIFAGALNATSGGATTPPGELVGTTLTQEGLAAAPIVYAGDFGNALCGTGTAELQPDCDSNTGSSNPFEPGTFNGEIVVCDRGTYGRIEKGKNLLLAGAGGYVLANTDVTGGEVTNDDQHCLPATHLQASAGNVLRDWLSTGSGHTASLSGLELREVESFGDRMSGFSSRGPTPEPAGDILKPNLIAPGDLIFAAGTEGSQVIGLGGTSMASPHVAGAAALVLAERPGLTPAQVASVLELTATDAIAKDENFGEATHHDTGAGRPQLFDAVTAGLYLDESAENFRDADPRFGGEPSQLNLASLTNSRCEGSCSFTRRIGAFDGGRTWTVSTSGFPAGVNVTVTPSSFTIPAGGEQEIRVDVDWQGAPELGNDWFFGKVHIDNPSYPTSTMPASIFASLGELPEELLIFAEGATGSQDVTIAGLAGLQQATFTGAGLVEPSRTVFSLVEDPSADNPYDGGQGVATVLVTVPANTLWFSTETPASDSEDVDLFVGFDTNGDGQAQESELVCRSITPSDQEFCDIFNPTAGSWWVIVQNWEAGGRVSEGTAQDITLVSAVMTAGPDSDLVATGPGITEPFEDFELRLSWQNVAQPGTELYGAVGVGSSRNGADIGVIPVKIRSTNAASATALTLLDGVDRAVAVPSGGSQEDLFIDVPPGVESLQVRVAGASAAQNQALELDIVRVSFDGAFGNAPSVALPGGATQVASAGGASGSGPDLTVSGGVTPGRYYAVVRNTGADDAAVRIRADLTHGGTTIDNLGGLWEPTSRPGINQGFEFTPAGGSNAFLWYTYEDDGSPVWYIASAPIAEGNRWQADLFRFTNDGETQAGTRVGDIAISLLGENDAVMSWTLFGEAGSDRVQPLSRTCPDGGNTSYTGLWYRGSDGLGGASIVANRSSQAHIHYLYDGAGEPRWLLAAGAFTDTELPLLQFSGFPPTGSGGVSSETVGLVTVEYDSNEAGQWALDYVFEDPARGGVVRAEDIVKLSNELSCAQ
ncbi:MAG: S8 family serine peptidase [Xanthomonadales bacterium]|jgi:subtilisin family serine protease|nr:S8 family serine peptidase [Xanthomonadales bacterium]